MIVQGDCLEEMRKMNTESVSAIITDPPYGLGFMGKKWDASLPTQALWEEALRISKIGAWALVFGGTRTFHRLTCSMEDAGWEIRDCLMWLYGTGFPKGKGCLKPAYEPIILARKRGPNPKLNIDECRIGNDVIEIGRWPANILLDEEASKMLDEQSGHTKSNSNSNLIQDDRSGDIAFSYRKKFKGCGGYDDCGGASRFFYCAKASSSERNAGLEEIQPIKCGTGALRDAGRGKTASNIHPTVKPLKLMEYLIKLIMPIDGILLDPFAGSGSTLVAANNLGVKAIGIELEEEYCKIANARLEACA